MMTAAALLSIVASVLVIVRVSVELWRDGQRQDKR